MIVLIPDSQTSFSDPRLEGLLDDAAASGDYLEATRADFDEMNGRLWQPSQRRVAILEAARDSAPHDGRDFTS
jgi:hypothetical protein